MKYMQKRTLIALSVLTLTTGASAQSTPSTTPANQPQTDPSTEVVAPVSTSTLQAQQPAQGEDLANVPTAPSQSTQQPPAASTPPGSTQPPPQTPPEDQEHTPIGAISTPAGTHRLIVRPGLDLIGQYSLRITNQSTGTDWNHRFDLVRAHAAITATWGPVRARLVLEAVRSASEGALLGVAGDSLLLRVREGYAAWRPVAWLEGQVGVVPTLTIPMIESAWGGRAIAAASLESTGLSSPADLGVTLRAQLPRSLGTLAAGAYNGEGYALRELNRGKNLEFSADVRPFATVGLRDLGLVASYVLGSSGTGRSRADRLTVGALFDRPRYGFGATTTIAWGVADLSDRSSILIEGFARGEPIQRWLIAARLSYWNRNTASTDDTLWTVLFGTGVRIADPLTAWIAVSRTVAGPATIAALPGVDAWEIRAVTRAVF